MLLFLPCFCFYSLLLPFSSVHYLFSLLLSASLLFLLSSPLPFSSLRAFLFLSSLPRLFSSVLFFSSLPSALFESLLLLFFFLLTFPSWSILQSNKRHTSFASVTVLPILTSDNGTSHFRGIQIPESELKIETMRSGGKAKLGVASS